MSETVADALTFYNDNETTETRIFIRLVDEFFDCLNVKNRLEGKLKRKNARLPYCKPTDHRFKVTNALRTVHGVCMCVYNLCYHVLQWLVDTFLEYLDERETEVSGAKEKSSTLLSRETNEGLHISGEFSPIHNKHAA